MLLFHKTSNRFYALFKIVSDFVLYLARRLYRDHCAQTAASLTYTSLLATVPFLVVSFSIIREFPVFPEMVSNLQSVILQIFTPDAGEGVTRYIQDIVNKGKRLPVLSFSVLFVTSVMMLYTMDDSLNRIWQVEFRRRTWFSLLVYFLVILSGPVLLGTSMVITTYLISRPLFAASAVGVNWLASVPWLVTFIAFTTVYRWVPNTQVRWKYALSGGLLASVLFELAKWGFALYIRWVPTYNLLYGTLAAIPLTLVWIYISWLVVLIGAETARCLATYRYGVVEADLTARQLLGFFQRGRLNGVTTDQISAWGYLGKNRIRRILQQLINVGLVSQTDVGKYDLTDEAREMSVSQLTTKLSEQLKVIDN